MAYTYRNKKTGDVIALGRRAKSAYWEEVEPEEEETFEAEDAPEEPVEETPKKTGRRGKK